ncbi:MAG: hypothetical protein RMK01_09655 [Thermomicrobium sp.]|nr:hypothetical protein [Thermomicrobium sp.]
MSVRRAHPGSGSTQRFVEREGAVPEFPESPTQGFRQCDHQPGDRASPWMEIMREPEAFTTFSAAR